MRVLLVVLLVLSHWAQYMLTRSQVKDDIHSGQLTSTRSACACIEVGVSKKEAATTCAPATIYITERTQVR